MKVKKKVIFKIDIEELTYDPAEWDGQDNVEGGADMEGVEKVAGKKMCEIEGDDNEVKDDNE